jgi:DNA processing protein
MTDRDRAYVWLAMSEGLGPRRMAKLLALCGDVVTLLGQSPAEWSRAVGGAVAANMLAARPRVDDMLETLERQSIRVVSREDDGYPPPLLNVYDPPVALFIKGSAALIAKRPIAMVGSRRCTRYGRETAHVLARDLATAGATVISGLARGIDTACHLGALAGGGDTIAVLGCGVDVVYPPENAALYDRVAEHGLLVSEYLPGTRPFASNFPLRNRIISGIARGVVLVEAAAGSGAMITVDYALEHGREIFAVPGYITAPQSAEPNRLIRDGAAIVTCADDILSALSWTQSAQPARENRVALQLSIDESRVISAVMDEEMSFEELLGSTGIDTASLNSLLTSLELRGIINRHPGRIFSVNRERFS